MSLDLEMAEAGSVQWLVAVWAELRTEGSSEKTQKGRECFQKHVQHPDGCEAVRSDIYKDLQG